MYWINSNNGDYVSLTNSPPQYILHLIERVVDGVRLPFEKHILTEQQFKMLKGFLPIKPKKFYNRKNTYAPTGKGGTVGVAKRTEVPTIQNIRNEILNSILK